MTPETRALMELYLRAERRIAAEIARKHARGLADYADQAALDRVQGILKKLAADTERYAPAAVESEYWLGARAAGYRNLEGLPPAELAAKHARGYAGAAAASPAGMAPSDAARRLAESLLGSLSGAIETAGKSAAAALAGPALGRRAPGAIRQAGLEAAAEAAAMGLGGGARAAGLLEEKLAAAGVTAFVDARGRKWRLSGYASMAIRTVGRQAANAAAILSDPEQDLYRLSSHGSACPLCAPLEGRVFSRGGAHPIYPPMSLAFGKIDKNGPDTLENTYLNIHPNCLHSWIPWSEAAHSDEEVAEARRHSDPKRNPLDRDPRSEARREAYRAREEGRRKLMEAAAQWRKYGAALGEGFPKTFQTFLKHKLANSEKYRGWERAYRAAGRGG
jgi:hypothetical protein